MTPHTHVPFGPGLSPQELRQRVGTMRQLAGVRSCVFADGPERGVRLLELYNAAGLQLDLLADRGLDIGRAAFGGIPLAWLSPAGMVHPAHYEPQGMGWLRTFGGGLLTTCGLTAFGPPETDRGEVLGLHGRASHLPASHVQFDEAWQDGDYCLEVRGQMRETALFGPNLLLRRRVRTRLWQPGLELIDVVTNEGHAPAEHMLLYHINLGYPLLDQPTRIAITASEARPRDSAAEAGFPDRWAMAAPQPGFAEQVYYYALQRTALDELATDLDESGPWAYACAYHPTLGGSGLALVLAVDTTTLPHLVEWKNLAPGSYVLGLEPATSYVGGRSAERAAGRVPVLAPGESRQYRLRCTILTGQPAAAAYTRIRAAAGPVAPE